MDTVIKIFEIFLEAIYRDWSGTTIDTLWILLCVYEIIVVAQYYDTDVNKEYAIRGNSAILKCVVPSFVADFVKVLSWHTDQGEEFVPGDDFGIIFAVNSLKNRSSRFFVSRNFHCCIFTIQWYTAMHPYTSYNVPKMFNII